MSRNPFTQPALTHEEFKMLEAVEAHFGYYLLRPEILAHAEIYADYGSGEISEALRVMVENDRADCVDGDECWVFEKSVRNRAAVDGKGLYLGERPYVIYGWTTYTVGEDTEVDRRDLRECELEARYRES